MHPHLHPCPPINPHLCPSSPGHHLVPEGTQGFISELPTMFALAESCNFRDHCYTSVLYAWLLVAWHWQLATLRDIPNKVWAFQLVLFCFGLSPNLFSFPPPIHGWLQTSNWDGWCHHSPRGLKDKLPLPCHKEAHYLEGRRHSHCKKRHLGLPSLSDSMGRMELAQTYSVKPSKFPRTVSKDKNPSIKPQSQNIASGWQWGTKHWSSKPRH